jgi:two-component system sensor histidine kinase and response regulator WspE
MDSDALRPLFRQEYQRVRAQLLPLLEALDPQRLDKDAVEPLRRRFLALKSAAGVVRLDWLERLAELAEQRLGQALAGSRPLVDADLRAMRAMLDLAAPIAEAEGAAWGAAAESARAAVAPLFAQLRGQRSGEQPLAGAQAAAQAAAPAVPPAVPPAAEAPAPPPAAPPAASPPPAAAAAASRPPVIAPALPPASAAAAKGKAAMQGKMLELFRHEVGEHGDAIQRALLRMEASPEQAVTQVMPIMRAAHAIKGAARAVRVEPAVQLAHAFEDRLQAAQRGSAPISTADVELFLQVNDLLLQVAREAAEPQAATQEAVRRALAALALSSRPADATLTGTLPAPLQSAAPAQPAPPAAAPVAAPPPSDAVPPPATQVAQQPASAPPAEVAQPPSAQAPARGATIAVAEALAAKGDGTLRVLAEPVNALLGLSAQQVVESAQLRSFQMELRQLRLDAKAAIDQLEELHQLLGAPQVGTEIGSAIHALRNGLRDKRKRLGEFSDHFYAYAGGAEHMAQRMYRNAMQIRLRPLGDILMGFPRMVRDLARKLDKRVRLVMQGEELSLDREVMERLEAPLTQLLRNAIDHGIEPAPLRAAAGKPEVGEIRIRVQPHAGMLALDVADDGGGIDPERIRRTLVKRGMHALEAQRLSRADLYEQLFKPGFSTADEVTEVSGRGVGLDVVRASLHDIGGSVRVSSTLGVGTTFHLLVPLSRSVVRAVVVDVAGEVYGFPLARIGRLLRVPASALPAGRRVHYVHVAGSNVRLVSLASLLELGEAPLADDTITAVAIDNHNRPFAFVVGRVLGEFDLSVRPIDARLGRVSDLSAAALLPDGRPVLIIDVDDLLRSAERQDDPRTLTRAAGAADGGAARQRRILVTDDSISVRELVRQLLVGRGYHVEVAVDGSDAWRKVRDEPFDMLITDVDMPRMDGIQLTRSVKQDPNLRKMPVMIVSYRDHPEDRARGMEARADCYVTKSDFHDERFLELVGDLLGAVDA